MIETRINRMSIKQGQLARDKGDGPFLF